MTDDWPVYFLRDADGDTFKHQGVPWATPVPNMARFLAWQLNKVVGERFYKVMKFHPGQRTLAAPWDKDISGELAVNPGPYDSETLNDQGGWWQRELKQIDKVTFHHTLSHDPYGLAAYYVDKDGGRPTMPYTLWVTKEGVVYHCVALTEGLWHDHTGNENTHLSVGFAGSLHLDAPPEVQLRAGAKVAAWAIKSRELPLVKKMTDITGHMDWIKTACPGWNSAQTGYWKPRLYTMIEEALK